MIVVSIYTSPAFGFVIESEEDEISVSRLLFEDSSSVKIEEQVQRTEHAKYFIEPDKSSSKLVNDRSPNDFVEQVHIVFMNHLGLFLSYYFWMHLAVCNALLL